LTRALKVYRAQLPHRQGPDRLKKLWHSASDSGSGAGQARLGVALAHLGRRRPQQASAAPIRIPMAAVELELAARISAPATRTIIRMVAAETLGLAAGASTLQIGDNSASAFGSVRRINHGGRGIIFDRANRPSTGWASCSKRWPITRARRPINWKAGSMAHSSEGKFIEEPHLGKAAAKSSASQISEMVRKQSAQSWRLELDAAWAAVQMADVSVDTETGIVRKLTRLWRAGHWPWSFNPKYGRGARFTALHFGHRRL